MIGYRNPNISHIYIYMATSRFLSVPNSAPECTLKLQKIFGSPPTLYSLRSPMTTNRAKTYLKATQMKSFENMTKLNLVRMYARALARIIQTRPLRTYLMLHSESFGKQSS